MNTVNTSLGEKELRALVEEILKRDATVLHKPPRSSTQAPRAVELTHENLLTNLKAIRRVSSTARGACVLPDVNASMQRPPGWGRPMLGLARPS